MCIRDRALPLTGVILTKVDGDARGGAALSIRQITGKPIKFLGVGEKTEALEPLHPDCVACLLYTSFTYIELNQVKDLSGDFLNWKMFLPFVSIELISLYLFRVILTHYNSIKTQIMQLELRQTLCQFIQSYVEYAKEIKEKDGDSLEKFENLIFSSIQMCIRDRLSPGRGERVVCEIDTIFFVP